MNRQLAKYSAINIPPVLYIYSYFPIKSGKKTKEKQRVINNIVREECQPIDYILPAFLLYGTNMFLLPIDYIMQSFLLHGTNMFIHYTVFNRVSPNLENLEKSGNFERHLENLELSGNFIQRPRQRTPPISPTLGVAACVC